jgi:hypothetical protein
MACPFIYLRTDLLPNAQTGGFWTYNGYAEDFDGDKDNFMQFTDTPASEPEELGDPLVGDSPGIDPTGHSVGFYSFTYQLDDGDCRLLTNVVLPIVETFSAGQTVLKSSCAEDGSTYQLFDLVSNFGALDVATHGYWVQVAGTPNPHPGFYNPSDPTLATFDPSTINFPSDVPSWIFKYVVPQLAPEGFTNYGCTNCNSSTADVRIGYYIVNNQSCCPGQEFCHVIDIQDGETIYAVWLTVGSITNVNAPMNFPYTLPADNADFLEDLNNFLINNGGGYATLNTEVSPGWTRIRVFNPCVAWDRVCRSSDCTTFTNAGFSECP